MRRPRFFAPSALRAGAAVGLDEEQARHVLTVLRLTDGARLRLFNPQDGEWEGALQLVGKRGAQVALEDQVRAAEAEAELVLMFAPVKRQATDWIIEKATELGATLIIPVITKRTIVETVRLDRWRAIAIDAAQQCERLDAPMISAPQPLAHALAHWPVDKILLCADEAGGPRMAAVLQDAPLGAAGVLIGPEGGFDPAERTTLLGLSFVRPFSFGRRILRAETAALAGLALLGAARGG